MPFEKNSWYYTFTLSKRLPDKTVRITRKEAQKRTYS